MKRSLRKNFDGEKLIKEYQRSLTIQQNHNRVSHKSFKCFKHCFKRNLFNDGFKIFLPDHPEPQ